MSHLNKKGALSEIILEYLINWNQISHIYYFYHVYMQFAIYFILTMHKSISYIDDEIDLFYMKNHCCLKVAAQLFQQKMDQ